MSELFVRGDNAGPIEVRAYRDGQLVHRELCESAEDAAAVVSFWEEHEGVACEVDDLSHEALLDDEAPTDLFETIIDDRDER